MMFSREEATTNASNNIDSYPDNHYSVVWIYGSTHARIGQNGSPD
jgi:hypothetical protein